MQGRSDAKRSCPTTIGFWKMLVYGMELSEESEVRMATLSNYGAGNRDFINVVYYGHLNLNGIKM